ncbi:unnamed protein product [Leptidea sinapis]|uniref:GDP-fucose protein O-fucosyltransferase 2 n=1 Tax=Leptidea sinapis TaxID=189913 RepID=A0A5E4R131_9NEOP|nr:unnamed protein product [Leptidea sinapis]
MRSVFTIIICVLLQTPTLNSDIYCDSENETCTRDISGEKFIFYDVNPPEGFNLRRDVYMRFAIMLAEAKRNGRKRNWHLVLPPWHNLYHWKNDKSDPIPWSSFFDTVLLKSYTSVVELHEVFSNIQELKIDRLYVLQNYPNAFENGDFTEKWKVADTCNNYERSFWGYKNISVKEEICINFQGKISQLWDVIALHPADKHVMFSHGEIPLHDTYGTKTYWDCRRSMVFNKQLIEKSEQYISKYLNCHTKLCSNYLSVHWRRQDFAQYRKNKVPSIAGTARQIDKAIKNFNSYIYKVYVATDAPFSVLRQLETELTYYGYTVFYYLPSDDDIETFKDGGLAIIDQIICSHAAYFIGTHESTFTYRIQEEREILGFYSTTTFNRFCPDKGQCEKPSKWTIVH